MENIERPHRIIRVSKKLAIFVGILVLLGVLAWVFIFRSRGPIYMSSGIENIMVPQMADQTSIAPDRYPYYGNNISTKDTREFMKVYYNAEIKTRDVKDAAGDVKNAVRDVEGRIDQANESPEHAYFTFVVPKKNFENFRAEIESIRHEKLISVNINSQNLLGQKQSIEEWQKNTEERLTSLEADLKNLTARHNQTLKNLQASLASTQAELAQVRAAIAQTLDQDQLSALRAQETTLGQSVARLNSNINSENSSFATSKANLDAQIASAKTELENVTLQDEDFTENIETVEGSVSVRWISMWQLAKIFSPIHPTWIIIILAAIIWYLLKRKNYLPGVEFV